MPIPGCKCAIRWLPEHTNYFAHRQRYTTAKRQRSAAKASVLTVCTGGSQKLAEELVQRAIPDSMQTQAPTDR